MKDKIKYRFIQESDYFIIFSLLFLVCISIYVYFYEKSSKWIFISILFVLVFLLYIYYFNRFILFDKEKIVIRNFILKEYSIYDLIDITLEECPTIRYNHFCDIKFHFKNDITASIRGYSSLSSKKVIESNSEIIVKIKKDIQTYKNRVFKK